MKGKDLKSVDAAGLHKAGEELAALLQMAAAQAQTEEAGGRRVTDGAPRHTSYGGRAGAHASLSR